MKRTAEHFRALIAAADSVNPQMAASAVYAATYGEFTDEASTSTEWRTIARRFMREHGDSVPADAVLAEMDSARRAERYGTVVKGWTWRTAPELLERAEAARLRLGMSKTQFIEHALNLAISVEDNT